MKKKIKIGNTVGMGLLLEFEIAFPGEKPLRAEEYLKGAGRDFILQVASFFLGFKSNGSKFNDNIELLGAIFGSENNGIANEVYDKIKAVERTGPKISIIHPYSSLKLFEYFFRQEVEVKTQTNAEIERNLFKAYLVINSEWTKAQEVASSSVQELDIELQVPMKFFCMQYPFADKTNYSIEKIWATQAIKAVYLFQFLEENEKTKPLLNAFVEYFDCSTWRDYLKHLLPLTMSSIQKENEAHTDFIVPRGERFEKDCAFIEKLIVQENETFEENDFLTIRAKPFYKVEEGVYRIIFDLFVVEKIFKGVYFLLRNVNDTLPKADKIKELRSFYGYEFSEKQLFYKVIESIFPDKSIQFSGKELDDMKVVGAPDYYVRKGKNVFLFESKDFLIRADRKASFNFEVYEEDFQKVLYYEEMPNGTEKHKGVMQLISSVRKLLKTEFSADKDYYYKDIFIHPILITHDHQYDTPGFNNLIDYWFQDELEVLKEEGLFIHRVKPLTVVNIDSLIFHQVGLAKDISLSEVLSAYYEHIKIDPKKRFYDFEEKKAYLMSKTIPFSHFIDQYFTKKGAYQFPPLLSMVAPVLFKNESK
ncbi:hypothetical protein [Nafulsella turpanensis]|uniref:hypothetical protein n=1 Tax=Nafulsella turpanensis TaxID=1265690 RepID=UPI0003484345|nr:hypothetical protein [Nafulsella turpanensis]